MKCKNCGNILDSNANICFLCGNTDLEPLNNNDYINNNENDNYINNNEYTNNNENDNYINNNEYTNNDLVMNPNNGYNNINNNISTNNSINTNVNYNINNNIIDDGSNVRPIKKKNIFKGYIIISFVLITIFVGIGIIDIINSVYNYKEISEEKITSYMKEKGFVLTDMTHNYSHLGYIDKYYSFKRGSVSLIYLTFTGDNSMYNGLKKIISVYEKNAIVKKEINRNKINKYELKTRTKYGYIIRVDNTILYTLTDSKYSNFVYSIFEDLGYGDINYKLVILSFGGAFVVIFLLELISLWKIFVKTGRNGAISIVPIYNIYVLNKLIVGNGWLCILMFIPFVNFIYLIYFYYKFGKMFGKKIGFILGLIFLNIIFIPILACDKSDYLGIKKI